ncbi:MAG: RagB/SusD family nutrient uptake outer membrane protein [Prevotellaceae bacterium]|nr:RagB/SusD family nutrient uptake outer membrane protein [Prevotellaceae bacterium]
MIKFKNIIWMGALALSTVSCSDFLETAPADLLATDDFFQTATQCEQAVIGVYSDIGLINNYEFLHMSECRSDNAWVDPEPNGLREYSEIGTFRVTDDLGMLNDTWNLFYKVIYDANVALEAIEKCNFDNESIKDQFLGEVHFLRGWCYFELTRLWGNVPLVDAPLSPSEANSVTQSAPREIIDAIVIPDLEEAIDKLPQKSGMVDSDGNSVSSEGRVDKVAAMAMLARVYTTLAGFPYNDSNATSLAKTQLQAVLAYEDDYWAPDITEWRKQWMPSTEYYNKYSIFAIQYRIGEQRNNMIFNMSPGLPTSYTTIRLYGNSIYVEKHLAYEFERTYSTGEKDGRGLGFTTLEGYEAETNYNAYSNTKDTIVHANGAVDSVYVKTMFYKYLPSKPKLAELGMSFDETELTDYDDWPVNFPVIRIEDMMLLYAEILANEGNISSAMEYVNKIRTRAGCDAETASTAEEALSYIKRERRVELAGEGVRWFDIVRYGEWQSTIINMFNSYRNPSGTDVNNVKTGRYLYAIPLIQQEAVPGLYVQNEGY